MAKLVLGWGTSHSLMSDAGRWLRRGESVKSFIEGRGLDLSLLEHPRPELEGKLTLERCEEDFRKCNVAVKTLGDVLERANVDSMVVVTNLHGVPKDDYQSIFGIYTGDRLPIGQFPGGGDDGEGGGERRGEQRGERRNLPEWAAKDHPADSGLAKHLMRSLIEDGFDVAYQAQYREGAGIGHEHTVMYASYLRKETPIVPFQVSRYLPNQATSERCYALGQALRRAMDSWDSDKRVAIVASGGLSHQIVDEEFDQAVIAALLEKDRDYLCSLSRDLDRLNVLPGTAETLNWVTVAGATEDMQMTLVDYVPSYWSVYGTGHGFCFSYWQ